MEEETIASKDFTLVHVAASTEVSDGKKGDEEASLNMESEPNFVAEPSFADAPSNEEQLAEQRSSRKKKKKMAAQEKMRALELDNVQLKEKMTEAEEQLNALQALLASLSSDHKELESTNENTKDRSLQADIQAPREEELERLLEASELSAKDANDRILSLQQELEGLQERVMEKEKLEESLEIRVREMYEELELLRASELQLKGDLMESEALLFSTKSELQAKVSELDALAADALIRNSELVAAEASALQKSVELEGLLEAANAVTDETRFKLEEIESKFEAAVQRNMELESALSQSSALEVELNKLVERCLEHESQANAAHERNLELEDLVRSSYSKAEESDRRVSELESLLETQKSKMNDLEDTIEAASEKEKESEAEKERMEFQLQELRLKIAEMESALNQSLAAKIELDAELKEFSDRYAECEVRATAFHERNQELEELVRSSHYRIEDSERRVSELELVLATQKSKMNDLENALEVVSEKEKESETEKERMNLQVQELTIKLTEMESAMNQSVAVKFELEAELKEFSDKYADCEGRANAVHERNQELEELVRSSHYRIEDSERRVSELEVGLETQKSRVRDLDQVIATMEQKCRYAETELVKHSDMVSALTTEKEELTCRVHEVRQKIVELESELGQSLVLKSELEVELKRLGERCAEHESRANAAHERNLELEDLLQSSYSKVEDYNRRASELESLLEAQKSKMNDLENRLEVASEKEKESEIEKERMNLQVQDLRNKLTKMESAMNQSLAVKIELEAELKELSDKYAEQEGRANAIHERNQELEELVRSSQYRIEESDRKVTEMELSLEAHKSRSNDLEQVIETLEEKCQYAETELMKHSHMVSRLTIELQSANTTAAEELKKLDERCAEHERRANAADERNLELEDLVQSSYFKIEESERRVSELEFLLETQKSRAKDLEQDIDSLVQNFEQAEVKAREYAEKVSALTVELEKSCLAISKLENALEAAAEDERQLTEQKGKSEEALHDSLAKLQEAEILLGLLHKELIATQGKLESVENDLKAAGIAQIDITEKLESAEFQLQQQGRALQEATANTTELESRNAILMKDTELKLQELQILGDRLKDYEDQAAEASYRVAAMTEELNQSCTKLASLEKLNEELKKMVVDADSKSMESHSKLTDLQETLSATLAERDYAVERFETSLKATEDLRQELSSDRQSFQNKIASIMEETRLIAEANSIAENELQISITELERQLKEYKESNGALNAELEYMKVQAVDNFALQSRVTDLEEQLLITEAHFKKEIASIMEEKRLLGEANSIVENELQTSIIELDRQLREYKERNGALNVELENLKLLATENSALQSRVTELEDRLLVNEAQFEKKICSIMEEKQLLNEENRMAQVELQTLIAQLEEQLNEYKKTNDDLHTELENMNLQAIDSSALQSRVTDLEEQLLITEALFKKEIASIMEEKRLLGEANSIAENELQNSIIELDRKMSEYKEINRALNSELENMKLQAADNSTLQIRVTELEEQLLANEAQFEKKICSLMEEKQILNEENRMDRVELQTLIAQLEEQLNEYKKSNDSLRTELENMKLQAADNSTLQIRVSDLEQQLLVTEVQFKKEISSIMEEKQLHDEANRVSQNELQTLIAQLEEQLYVCKKDNEVLHNELENTKNQAIPYDASQTRVRELEELLLATEAHFQKEVEYIRAAAAAREVELRSMLEQHIQNARDRDALSEKKEENRKVEIVEEKGDIGSNIVATKKREMKKPGRSSKQVIDEASSSLKNIKIAVGVGIVSIIAGMLAGKK